MYRSKKHWLSVLTLLVFVVFALASKSSKVSRETFGYTDTREDVSTKGNYIVMEDGTKVYGYAIGWQSGLTLKDVVVMDEKKYKISDVKGFMRGGNYYTRFHKGYIQRLVHGKINVYVKHEDHVSAINENGRLYYNSNTRTEYYYQIGEDGDLKKFNRGDIQGLLKDCPTAAAMADISKKQLNKALEEDPNYMNKVFHIYNSGCK